MIEKIPIVIPKSERKVLNLLIVTEVNARIILSLKSFKNFIRIYALVWEPKDKKKHMLPE
jgi:hypothetical protein